MGLAGSASETVEGSAFNRPRVEGLMQIVGVVNTVL